MILCSPSQTISGVHCELELQNGYWFVRDLRSRNGIKVNGERYDSKWLHPGDELSIAKHRFEVTYEPLSDGPPPEEEDIFAKSLLERAGLVRQEHERPPRDVPRATTPLKNRQFSAIEDQAAAWLMEDED